MDMTEALEKVLELARSKAVTKPEQKACDKVADLIEEFRVNERGRG